MHISSIIHHPSQVSWAIDPALGEQFPALFDYFAATAGVNDSFVSGPGGCGYVYYGRMTDAQIKTFAARCGRLMKACVLFFSV